MGKISYETWRGHVCRILVSQGHVKHESKISPDIYRPYYEDGLSPAKAVREDLGMNAIWNYGGVYPDREDWTNGDKDETN